MSSRQQRFDSRILRALLQQCCCHVSNLLSRFMRLHHFLPAFSFTTQRRPSWSDIFHAGALCVTLRLQRASLSQGDLSKTRAGALAVSVMPSSHHGSLDRTFALAGTPLRSSCWRYRRSRGEVARVELSLSMPSTAITSASLVPTCVTRTASSCAPCYRRWSTVGGFSNEAHDQQEARVAGLTSCTVCLCCCWH